MYEHFSLFLPKGTRVLIHVYPYDKVNYVDHVVVADYKSQNGIREALSILRKHGITRWNLAVMRSEDGKGYRLLHSGTNAGFIGGILFAVQRSRSKRRKKAV